MSGCKCVGEGVSVMSGRYKRVVITCKKNAVTDGSGKGIAIVRLEVDWVVFGVLLENGGCNSKMGCN